MVLSRRGFLKLLGVGAAGTFFDPTGPIQLFGTSEQPGQDLGTHHVLYMKRGVERVKGFETTRVHATSRDHASVFTHADYQVVARIPKKIPQGTVYTAEGIRMRGGYVLPGEASEFDSPGTGSSTLYETCSLEGDVNANFYQAAEKMRTAFTAQSKKLWSELDTYQRQQHCLVTVVYDPIHARTSYEGQFQTGTTFHTMLMDRDLTGLNEFEVYSNRGEYPIEVPSVVQMQALLAKDPKSVWS